MIDRINLLFFAILFAPASLSWGQEATAKRQITSIDAINAAMQRFVDDGKIAGAVTLVGHKGRIVHLGAVGHADIESDKKMRTFKLFSIASMTKPITATAVMILQDEGKLHVDDEISKYIPAFKDVKLRDGSSPRHGITIRDAITHTSGITGNQVFESSLEAAVDDIATRPLAFEPGSKWQYSPGMNVVGRIVEIVSEQAFEDFVQQRIFEPLAMTNTTFYPNRKQRRQIATLYRLSEDEQSLVAVENRITDPENVKAANPSGGLFATARDMFRFYQMVLNRGQFRKKTRVVSEDAVKQMTSPQTGDLITGFTPGNCWGLGWCIVREPQGVTKLLSPETFGHGGAFGTQGWVDPKTRTIYVLMIQRSDIGNGDGSDIRQVFQQAAKDALEL
jgi:CubicO group peptidase (beta-lactamase class C family)